MARGKIPNEQELIAWIEDGKKYSWIVDEIKRKYDVDIKPVTIASFRNRRGLKSRQVRDWSLIPWKVEAPHRNLYAVEMLRVIARHRAGGVLTDREMSRMTSFQENLKEADAVVAYDPSHPKGFYYVAREDTDDDIIRRPREPTREL